jgi:TolB-like protein
MILRLQYCLSRFKPGNDREYFSDGLAEELINDLAQVPGLKVVAFLLFSIQG